MHKTNLPPLRSATPQGNKVTEVAVDQIRRACDGRRVELCGHAGETPGICIAVLCVWRRFLRRRGRLPGWLSMGSLLGRASQRIMGGRPGPTSEPDACDAIVGKMKRWSIAQDDYGADVP